MQEKKNRRNRLPADVRCFAGDGGAALDLDQGSRAFLVRSLLPEKSEEPPETEGENAAAN